MAKPFEPVGGFIFDVSFMSAEPVASVNLKCGATLLQHLIWKVSQKKAVKIGLEYIAGLLLDRFKSQTSGRKKCTPDQHHISPVTDDVCNITVKQRFNILH